MAFKYAVMMISTNFELEPVLKQYFDTYPDSTELHNYQIIFKTEGEHHPDSKSYLILHEQWQGQRGMAPRLAEFLKSYCTFNNLVAVAHSMGSVMPDVSGRVRAGLVFGRYLARVDD